MSPDGGNGLDLSQGVLLDEGAVQQAHVAMGLRCGGCGEVVEDRGEEFLVFRRGMKSGKPAILGSKVIACLRGECDFHTQMRNVATAWREVPGWNLVKVAAEPEGDPGVTEP